MKILRIFIILSFLLSILIGCTKEDTKSNTSDVVLGLVSGQGTEASKDFILNGSWNSFTGNSTTSNTIATYNAKAGAGVLLNDSSTGSTFYTIGDFSNSSNYYIAQNPPYGGAFSGFADTNKGKYYKTVFFKEPTKTITTYWICTLVRDSTFAGDATVAQAITVTDNSDKSKTTTTGCGGFPWSRLEKRL
jgi:hypothetical protein